MVLTNYWWLLIWILLIGAFFRVVPVMQKENVLGKTEDRWKITPAIIVVLPYILWAGFRTNIFGDTLTYRELFQQMPSSLERFGDYLTTVTKDVGFSVLTFIIKFIFGNSDIIYFLILAAFQILCIALVFRKYSCNYWLSIFIFIASTDYMSWTHNGVRQFTAVALIFAATSLILKKKYIPLIFVILLASTIHGSAILMLPVIFIIQGKAGNRKTLLLILVSIVALFFIDQFTNILDTLLSNTQYTNVVSDWRSWDDDGTNPIRVLVYSIPTIIALLRLKQIQQEDDPVVNMAVNASCISTAIYLVSMGTSGVFIGRIPIYVSLYACGILLPWEIKHLFSGNSVKVISIVTVLCYIAFFYYQMHIGWGLL